LTPWGACSMIILVNNGLKILPYPILLPSACVYGRFESTY
jgi:hypothetical protein